MKIFKKIALIAVVVFTTVISSSCSSDSSNDNEQTPTEDFIKFKYNGVVYKYEPELIISEATLIRGASGMGDTYKSISLWLPNDFTKGSHPVVYNLSELTTTYQGNFSFNTEFNNANATSGTIKITKLTSERIEGTFSFSGTQGGETFAITDGSFSLENF
ncbi:MAG: hypothetical protein V4572_05980 [Bacteroidota bacterium]